jgi:hypothetical protein
MTGPAPTPQVPPPAATAPQFNPFTTIPYLAFLHGRKARWLLLGFPIALALIVTAAALEGTLGTLNDFQIWTDLKRAVGVTGLPDSKSNFPVTRDLPSIILVLVIFLTMALTLRQWTLMSKTIPALLASGALSEKTTPSYSTKHKLLGIKKLMRGKPATTSQLDFLFERINAGLGRVGSSSGWLVLFSGALAILVILGPTRNGVFVVVAPDNLPAGIRQWQDEAYASWWAAINHAAGFLVYILLMFLGIYVVLIQNIVGLFACYTLTCLKAIADFDLDWLNRDGEHGWKSIRDVYRTVIISLAMHGLTISMVVVSLGIANVPWMLGVVGIFAIMLPATTIVPISVFSGLRDTACKKRIELIEAQIAASPPSNPLLVSQYRTEIAQINATRVKPLRLGALQLPTFLITVLLPITLTVIQVLVQIKTSGK